MLALGTASDWLFGICCNSVLFTLLWKHLICSTCYDVVIVSEKSAPFCTPQNDAKTKRMCLF